MAEEDVSDNPFEEAVPVEPGRLNAPHPSTETAAVAPPSYSDALQPPAPRLSVNTVPQRGQPAQRNGRSSSSTDETVPLITSTHRRRQKPQGTAKAFLLLLGIGQWYSGVCIFISFAFFSVGLAAVILSVINFEALKIANITTIVGGVVFVLISILWPCSWAWDQCSRKTGCSYTPLLFYSWLLSLAYVGVIGALVISFSEHYDCVLHCKPELCPNNSTDVVDNDNLCVYVRVPFVMLAVMVVLAVGLILISCVCCTDISCETKTQRNAE